MFSYTPPLPALMEPELSMMKPACLLALSSLATLLAARLSPRARLAVVTAAWYRKRRPTFADTLAAVRREFWREQGFLTSHPAPGVRKLRTALREGITYALCHAA